MFMEEEGIQSMQNTTFGGDNITMRYLIVFSLPSAKIHLKTYNVC